MKYYLTLSFILASVLLLAQENTTISIGTYDSLFSEILDERRDLQIYLPPNYSPEKLYPVVYLLDGDRNFHPFTGAAYHLALNFVIPEMIVVGILNTNRVRDFTPTHDPDSHDPTNGGGEAFVSFLRDELIPYIENKYSAVPYRILTGHSAGGLLVTHILLNHTKLFNSYIAIDPSLWWDNMKLIDQSPELFREDKFQNKNYFMAMANSMPMGMKDISIALKDTTNATLGIRSVFIFDEKLRTSANKDLRWATKYYENEFHGSVPLLGYYDALKFFFDFYMRPSFQTLTDSTGIILENHFKMVSERMGYEILPSETELAGLAWRSWAMEGNFERALIFLELYMKLYPESAGAHASMGQYFREKGDEESANSYFKKARELSERE